MPTTPASWFTPKPEDPLCTEVAFHLVWSQSWIEESQREGPLYTENSGVPEMQEPQSQPQAPRVGRVQQDCQFRELGG